ncbi:MAG: alanine racemase [Methylococcales bacterium]
MSTRKIWRKPTITPHSEGTLNKFGRTPAKDYIEDIEGVPVNDLISKYGSPLFVLSEKQLRSNIRRLKQTFETRYQPVLFGWSYKTNYLNAVCAILHQEGAWAEVVSLFEYQKARALGVPGNRILFNGPHKNKETLELCVKEGARIHIDNMDELYLLEEVARAAEKSIPVTIRLNFDTGYTEPWCRFGFNIESGQAIDAARRIGSSQWLKLCGLHSHIGTFILEPRAYSAQVLIMCQFMETVEQQTDCIIDSLDIGGGFASRIDLQGMYMPAEQVTPTIEQYADAVCTTLAKETAHRSAQNKPRPTLIMESGRLVVDDAEVLIASVVSTRRLSNGQPAVVLDAGVNLLFTAFWYHHRIQPTRPLEGLAEDTVFYGPLCMNIDVVRQSVMIPPMQVGDQLVISPVGAYNNTQWLQFIEYRPNIVMIGEEGQVSIIRHSEDLAFMNQLERLPDHLNGNFKLG